MTPPLLGDPPLVDTLPPDQSPALLDAHPAGLEAGPSLIDTRCAPLEAGPALFETRPLLPHPPTGPVAPAGWPDSLLGGHPGGPRSARVALQTDCGYVMLVDAGRWHAPPDTADESVLAACRGRVLDIGCGPGRLTRALAERGVPCLGIDTNEAAVAAATTAGAPAWLGDVFAAVPRAGDWDTGLLLDGTIGIGGSPRRLLTRLRQVLAPSADLVVEVMPQGRYIPGRQVRICQDGTWSSWFPWALVGLAELAQCARETGWQVEQTWSLAGRSFCRLHTDRFEEAS